MPNKGFIHTQDSRRQISRSLKKNPSRGSGFCQKIQCPVCNQTMSPANLGKHLEPCRKVQGKTLMGKQLSAKQFKLLRESLKPLGWDVDKYLLRHNELRGLCAICGRSQSLSKGRLSADHSHASGNPRDLLCDKCNFIIGLLDEDVDILEKVRSYLVLHDETDEDT